jgi:hypothetical protein
MPRRWRVRRVLKVIGVVGSATFGLAWALSLVYSAAWVGENGRIVGVQRGAAWYIAESDAEAGWYINYLPVWKEGARWKFEYGGGMTFTQLISLPLWIPSLPFVLLLMLALWLDRHGIPPGHCPCGYNLTGNISGVCPECGTAVAGKETKAG